jgi:hypothetical protein
MQRDATGWPLQLILAGPAAGRALPRLEASIKHYDPSGAFVQYIVSARTTAYCLLE